MGLSRTVSEINADFSQQSQIFPTPGAFNAPAEGVTLRIMGTGALYQKNYNDGVTGPRKKFDGMPEITTLEINPPEKPPKL